jgi:hypothetical protein
VVTRKTVFCPLYGTKVCEWEVVELLEELVRNPGLLDPKGIGKDRRLASGYGSERQLWRAAVATVQRLYAVSTRRMIAGKGGKYIEEGGSVVGSLQYGRVLGVMFVRLQMPTVWILRSLVQGGTRLRHKYKTANRYSLETEEQSSMHPLPKKV